MTECGLEVRSEDGRFNTPCDGCGVVIGESPHISGIESCCGGGCVRNLCFDCVRAAYRLVEGFDGES
jgi:hypothetical protein